MATRIALAGFEVPKFAQCMADMGAKTVLGTYYGLRKQPDYIKQWKDKYPTLDIIADSGAFTFFNKEAQPVDFYRRYKDAYVKWIERNKGYLLFSAELDIDRVCPEAAKWRTDEFESLTRRGHNICFIWHDDTQTQQDWEAYCQRYRYVGIGKGYQGGDYNKYISIARKYLAKVHAFGYTKSTEIQNYGFFSADSSTWLLGSKYGETDVFDVDHIYRFDNSKKSMRQRFRTKFQNAGLDTSLIDQEDYYEVIKMNMLAFIEMEKFLARVNANRAYWNYLLPRPKKVDRMTGAEVDAILLSTLGWAEADVKNLSATEKQDQLYGFSLLQSGRYKDFKYWTSNQSTEDMVAVFGQDTSQLLAPFPDFPIEAFQSTRARFNLSLFRNRSVQKRGKEDFVPVKTLPKKRDADIPEDLAVTDTEGMQGLES